MESNNKNSLGYEVGQALAFVIGVCIAAILVALTVKLIRTQIIEGEYQMTINEYQKAAYRTANQSLTDSQQLQNGLMGLNGESGECIDILKKYLFQGHDLDKAHIAKELGDVAWYLAVSAQALGFDLETILQMNVEKLKARYPHGFNAGHSQHRSSGDI